MSKQNIYNILLRGLGNVYAVCGIMGNLQAESALHSNNLQNSGNRVLDMTDDEYTIAVDNGDYTNFVRDSHGYGLAQWTFWSRKDMLLDYAHQHNVSISDETMQCNFILHELETNYKGLLRELKCCTSVQEASDKFCTMYERPADQSRNALDKRAKYGNELYTELCSIDLTEANFLIELDALLNKYGYKRGA